jgi:hypothetical protein
VINETTGDREVTRNSPSKEKIAYARTLSHELDEEFKDTEAM